MPFLQKEINKQYCFLSILELALTPQKYRDLHIIPVKLGETIAQTIPERIHQIYKAGAQSAKLIPLPNASFEVSELKKGSTWEALTHIDDAIRDELIKSHPLVLPFERELIWLDVSSITKKLGIKTIQNEIVYNEEFTDLLGDMLYKMKTKVAKKKYGKKKVSFHVTLRTHQQEALDRIVKADKMYNLLGYCPRFGKTYTILEYAKVIARIKNDVVLVVASKHLSANESFKDDAKNKDYPFIIVDSSMFPDEESIIANIRKHVTEKSQIILVTDEADFASSTDKSIVVLKTIKEEFNVIKQVVMSGTSIHKAQKIYKEISLNDIYIDTINYTELLHGYDGISSEISCVVARDWYDILLTMKQNDMLLNIRESLEDEDRHEEIAVFLNNLVTSKKFGKLSKATMIFINTKDIKQLQAVADEYAALYPDAVVMSLHSKTDEKTSNRNAQQKVKDKLALIKKDPMLKGKRLVIFSREMSSRSFSVHEIHRVIVLADNGISENDYQKFARALTWKEGKSRASLIRVSFTELSLNEGVFTLENPNYTQLPRDVLEAKSKIYFSSKYNTFSAWTVDENGNFIPVNNNRTAAEYVDSLLKHADTAKSSASRLYIDALNLTMTVNIIKKDKTTTKAEKNVMLKAIKSQAQSGSKDMSKSIKDNILKVLEAYCAHLRVLPATAEVSTVNELIGLSVLQWKRFSKLDRNEFVENYNESKALREEIEFIYRNYDQELEVERLCDSLQLA